MKKFGLLMMTLCLTAVFLPACGEKTAEKVTLTHVYDKTEVLFRDSFGIKGGISSCDGMIYVCGTEGGGITAAEVDPDTLAVNYVPLPIDNIPSSFCRTAEGWAAVYSKVMQDEIRTFLCLLGEDDTMTEIDLSAHISFNSASLEIAGEGNISSREVLLAENDSGVYASSGTECLMIAYDGTVRELYTLSGEVCSMAADSAGNIRVLLDNGPSGLGTGEIQGETSVISYNTWITDWYNVTTADGAKVYADSFFVSVDSDAVYMNGADGVYRVEDSTAERILSWDNSGILYDDLCIVDGGSERFFITDKASSDNAMKLYRLDKGADVERTLVTVSYIGTAGTEIPEAAMLFNRQSQEYHVVCEPFDTSGEDYEQVFSAFDEAVLSGKAGDVMVFDTDYRKYAEQGVFADLTDHAAELELFPCIADALAVDGTLYALTPEFMVRTLVAQSDFAEARSIDQWNTAAFLNLAQMCGTSADTTLFNGLSRSKGADVLLKFGLNEFIDGTACSFDSPEFIALLRYLSALPETAEAKYSHRDGTPYQNGEVLLYSADLFDYGSWLALDIRFDGDFAFVGYPSETGGSAGIEPGGYYAVNGKSAVKDGAWEFVKFLMTDEEVSADRGISGIPSVKSLWDSWTEVQSNVQYFFERGSASYPEHYLPEWDIPAMEGILITLTDEVKAEMRAFVESLSAAPAVPAELSNMITEELSAFYSGIRQAEETADIIQSRAKIYVSEHEN